MKIAILQFNPALARVDHNIQHAEKLLQSRPLGRLDILVLPEMAFSGYNFPSLESIRPFLEPTAAGPTAEWAIKTATSLQTVVVVGYPEIATTRTADGASITTNYNSTVIIGPDGSILANYRKSFLYYTDETWAEEGFRSRENSNNNNSAPFFTGHLEPLGAVGHGICMDINPYKFTAPWTDYEFAHSMLSHRVKFVILSMAWLTRLLPEDIQYDPHQPDMDTVAYWLERFWPLVETRPRDPIIVVFANRCGTEGTSLYRREAENGEVLPHGDQVCYAGSSCVMRFHNGGVKLWEHHNGPHKGQVGLLGKGDEGILVVETANEAGFLLQQKET